MGANKSCDKKGLTLVVILILTLMKLVEEILVQILPKNFYVRHVNL